MTNEELGIYIQQMKFQATRIGNECVNADKSGDFLLRDLKEQLMFLQNIIMSLQNYDVDASVLTIDEINKMIYDANHISLKFANY